MKSNVQVLKSNIYIANVIYQIFKIIVKRKFQSTINMHAQITQIKKLHVS